MHLNTNNHHNHNMPSAASVASAGHATGANNAIHRSITRCLKIAPEERRFPQFEVEQSRILKDIMLRTNTKIEVTATKDGALNFIIFGRDSNINVAIELILSDFQTPVTLTVAVPKAIHGRLLGPKGARLSSIQEETQTKITMPRKDDESDVVRVVGLKANAEKAVQSIQKYVKEFSEKTLERVNVERIYLLFITGAFNENLKRWESLGVKVSTSGASLPNNNNNNNNNNHNTSHNNNTNKDTSLNNNNHNHHNDNGRSTDEVTFTIAGEMQAVNAVKSEILQIYEDKKKKCTTVNIEVKKAQHKYILGQGGHNLRSLFAKTGVSVELPTERESETITLRGELTKLGPALSELYSQAHSEMDAFIEVDNWLHKYLIGPRRTNPLDFKARGVFVRSQDDKIKLHGPPTEVEAIKETLENELSSIKNSIIHKNIRVESRIHGIIIGKQGATVEQIRVESGAYILVPSSDEGTNEYITLEGTPEAIAIAEEKINAIAKKYEASVEFKMPQKLFNQEKIQRQLVEEFNHEIVINFISADKKPKQQGNQNKSKDAVEEGPQKTASNNKSTVNGVSNKEGKTKAKSDNKAEQHITVKIRGPKDIIKEAEKKFEALMAENYQAVISVAGSVLDKFIPTDRTKVTKIKEAHNVKIIMPDKKTTTRTVRIVGSEKNVQAALQHLNKLIKSVEERIEEKIEISSQFHPRLIGSGGKSVRKIMDEFKVEVKFASQDDPNPNIVILYGKANNVEAAKNHMVKQTQRLLASMKKPNTNNNIEQQNSHEVPELNSSGATMAD